MEVIPPSELIDTTGAGDAFIGAILYERSVRENSGAVHPCPSRSVRLHPLSPCRNRRLHEQRRRTRVETRRPVRPSAVRFRHQQSAICIIGRPSRRQLGSRLQQPRSKRPDLSDPEAGRLHRPHRFIVVGGVDRLHQPLSDSNEQPLFVRTLQI
ncbi:hypothetical protein ACLOJK_007732 [Asimina triloba]